MLLQYSYNTTGRLTHSQVLLLAKKATAANFLCVEFLLSHDSYSAKKEWMMGQRRVKRGDRHPACSHPDRGEEARQETTKSRTSTMTFTHTPTRLETKKQKTPCRVYQAPVPPPSKQNWFDRATRKCICHHLNSMELQQQYLKQEIVMIRTGTLPESPFLNSPRRLIMHLTAIYIPGIRTHAARKKIKIGLRPCDSC